MLQEKSLVQFQITGKLMAALLKVTSLLLAKIIILMNNKWRKLRRSAPRLVCWVDNSYMNNKYKNCEILVMLFNSLYHKQIQEYEGDWGGPK